MIVSYRGVKRSGDATISFWGLSVFLVDVEFTEEGVDGSLIGTWNDGVGIEMPSLQIDIILPVLAEKSRHTQRVDLTINTMNVFVCAKFEGKNNSQDISIFAPCCQQLMHPKLYHRHERPPGPRNKEWKRAMVQEGGLVP